MKSGHNLYFQKLRKYIYLKNSNQNLYILQNKLIKKISFKSTFIH